MCKTFQNFNTVGLITSGLGRDLAETRALGFPVFTAGTACSHGFVPGSVTADAACTVNHLALAARRACLPVGKTNLTPCQLVIRYPVRSVGPVVPLQYCCGRSYALRRLGRLRRYAYVGNPNAPVHVGGLTVMPGDLLHGDQNGVTTIPAGE